MTRKYIMDKNSKKWCRTKEIKAFRPMPLDKELPISPTTPESYDGKRFEDFRGDEIGTEKITFLRASFIDEDFRNTELYKEYLLNEKISVNIGYPF